MIDTKDQKNKSPQGNAQNNFFSFEEVRKLKVKSREKMVQRQILAVKIFLEKSRQKNPYFSWSHFPWPIQFLPVITKFFAEWGKISAVNPGFSGFSGLMGTSKIEINKRLNEDFRPRNLFLEKLPKSREILERTFVEKYKSSLHYPVILKPSVGERCSGVNFILRENMSHFLEENSDLKKIILEEYIEASQEFGLSWIKNLEEGKIEILALTERITPRVVGYGKESLRTLIKRKCENISISKDRQEKIFAGFSTEELNEKFIGEKQFVRTASISYGTILKKIYLTNNQKEALKKLVTKMIINFNGIYVGRFDLKAENFQELLAGNCSIIEMNGVAGAPLDIYDKEIKIAEKYEILFDYFTRVLAIADNNIANNAGQPISKIFGIKTLSKLFFGKQKTQQLPENVWENLREVFKISLKERFEASHLGKVFRKFKN